MPHDRPHRPDPSKYTSMVRPSRPDPSDYTALTKAVGGGRNPNAMPASLTGKPSSVPPTGQNRGQIRSAQVHERNAARKAARRKRLAVIKAGKKR